jgi:hypothetical protein
MKLSEILLIAAIGLFLYLLPITSAQFAGGLNGSDPFSIFRAPISASPKPAPFAPSLIKLTVRSGNPHDP